MVGVLEEKEEKNDNQGYDKKNARGGLIVGSSTSTYRCRR